MDPKQFEQVQPTPPPMFQEAPQLKPDPIEAKNRKRVLLINLIIFAVYAFYLVVKLDNPLERGMIFFFVSCGHATFLFLLALITSFTKGKREGEIFVSTGLIMLAVGFGSCLVVPYL